MSDELGTRAVTYRPVAGQPTGDNRASREEYTRRQGDYPPQGGGAPLQGEQRRVFLTRGDYPAVRDGQREVRAQRRRADDGYLPGSGAGAQWQHADRVSPDGTDLDQRRPLLAAGSRGTASRGEREPAESVSEHPAAESGRGAPCRRARAGGIARGLHADRGRRLAQDDWVVADAGAALHAPLVVWTVERIAELARQTLGMAVAIAWLPGPAGTRRRVAKPSVEEPDAAEPARPDLWGTGVSNGPGLPDHQPSASTARHVRGVIGPYSRRRTASTSTSEGSPNPRPYPNKSATVVEPNRLSSSSR